MHHATLQDFHFSSSHAGKFFLYHGRDDFFSYKTRHRWVNKKQKQFNLNLKVQGRTTRNVDKSEKNRTVQIGIDSFIHSFSEVNINQKSGLKPANFKDNNFHPVGFV